MDQGIVSASPLLELLHEGFDGAAQPTATDRQAARLWRVGRWLRTQGSPRPRTVRVVNDWTIMIEGRILSMDDLGVIHDLTTTRRTSGTRLATLAAWGRRR